MQKADYELIYKRGRLTAAERHRLEVETEQGSINLPDTDTPSIFIAKAHKEMKARLAEEYGRTFADAINKILSCEDHIDAIREYLQTEGHIYDTNRAAGVIAEICRR